MPAARQLGRLCILGFEWEQVVPLELYRPSGIWAYLHFFPSYKCGVRNSRFASTIARKGVPLRNKFINSLIPQRIFLLLLIIIRITMTIVMGNLSNLTTTAEAAKYFTTIPGNRREREKLMKRFPGIQAAVAKRLRVRNGAVSQVWHLRSASYRITVALLEELNKRIAAERAQRSEVA